MKISAVISTLEKAAPPVLAEPWDNVGLLVGSSGGQAKKVLVCTDVTQQVLAEAQQMKAQLIVAHHPVIFKPLSAVTTEAAPLVWEAVRHDIALYAMHTNFDAAPGGTNDVLAEALGLTHVRPLRAGQSEDVCKIVTFLPGDDLPAVSEAAFAAGAGQIGEYFDCAFFTHGIGAFRGGQGTSPAIGTPGEHAACEEVRLEMLAPQSRAAEVIAAIRSVHSYETPAVDVYPLISPAPGSGQGRIGALPRSVTVETLVRRVKKALGIGKLRVAGAPGADGGQRKANLVTTAACCAGSGASLVGDAVRAGAGLYLTGEIGHHETLDAVETGLTVVAAGHGNSERPAMRRLAERLDETLGGVAVRFAASDRDPLRIT
ncbi:MAG: Nif3-like dinuclear metal center hexameric protein [Phycisphaerae bacterium]|nr:Nif3-like dinuclear metal center hexameric protein [Phycisphaerae bacterium]